MTGRARPHALLVASAAGLIGDLHPARDVDGEVRVRADVAEVDRAGLTEARGDAASAACVRGRADRRRARDGPALAMLATLMPARVVAVGSAVGLRRGP